MVARAPGAGRCRLCRTGVSNITSRLLVVGDAAPPSGEWPVHEAEPVLGLARQTLSTGARRSMRRLVAGAPSMMNSTRATVERPVPSIPMTLPSP